MNKQEAVKLLGRLVAAFPACKLTQDSVNLYVDRLMAFEQLRAASAIECVIDNCKFFPSWAQILETMNGDVEHCDL